MRNVEYLKHELVKFFNSGSKTALGLSIHLGVCYATAQRLVALHSDLLVQDGSEKTGGTPRPKYRLKEGVAEMMRSLPYEPVRAQPYLDKLFRDSISSVGYRMAQELARAQAPADRLHVHTKFAEAVFEHYEGLVQASRNLVAENRLAENRASSSMPWQSLVSCWGSPNKS